MVTIDKNQKLYSTGGRQKNDEWPLRAGVKNDHNNPGIVIMVYQVLQYYTYCVRITVYMSVVACSQFPVTCVPGAMLPLTIYDTRYKYTSTAIMNRYEFVRTKLQFVRLSETSICEHARLTHSSDNYRVKAWKAATYDTVWIDLVLVL